MRDELRGPPADVRIGDLTVHVEAPSYTAPKDTSAVQRNGALGNGALQGRHLFIDYLSKRLVLQR